MFGFVKAKLDSLANEYARFADKDTAEALVAIQAGCAYSDGELEAAEKAKLIASFKVSPILKIFPQSVLLAKWNELSELLDFDTATGVAACLKELQDLVKKGASEEKRLAVLRMGVASAKADGEIEAAELDFLRKAASALGLSLSQVSL